MKKTAIITLIITLIIPPIMEVVASRLIDTLPLRVPTRDKPMSRQVNGGAASSSILKRLLGWAEGGEVETTKAVIHHTDSPYWTTVEDIDQWHKERGWDGIGYHFVIYPDGSIHQGRPLWKQGAHALGRNNWLGIALVGNGKFTAAQGKGLETLFKRFNVQHIERHHEDCPGPGINFDDVNVYHE